MLRKDELKVLIREQCKRVAYDVSDPIMCSEIWFNENVDELASLTNEYRGLIGLNEKDK